LKISIVTVTYNSSDFISHCLKSVKLQNYNNIEHIVIDGASTDNTLSILKNNKKQLSTLISEPDKGIYDAMNKGIKISTGDIIGFLNSDDFYSNNEVLSKIANVFNNDTTLEACYADLLYTDRNDISKNVRYWKSNKFTLGSFEKGWCPPHPTFFCKRSVYEKYGYYNLNYNIAADVELMMRFLEVNKINVQYIPTILVKMRIGGISNKSLRNILNVNKEILYALKKHNLSKNSLIFFSNKIWSRAKQFFQKPT